MWVEMCSQLQLGLLLREIKWAAWRWWWAKNSAKTEKTKPLMITNATFVYLSLI